MRPLISIIVPAFIGTPAQEALLAETLATVAQQRYDRYEVIVVDDGSPREVSRSVSSHGNTRVLRQANAGCAVARNTGLAHSSGEYIVFLDADDHLLPPALETGLDVLRAHPGCEFAVGPREEMTFEGDPVPWSVPPPPPQSEIYQALLGFDWYIIPPSSAIFARTLVDRIGGFQDPWGADDLDFYLRAARQSRAWCYQSPAVTRYRRYSASSSRDGARMLHSMRVVYDRQWPLVQGDAAAEAAFHRGLAQLTEIFLDCLVENVEDRLRDRQADRARQSAQLLAVESPPRFQALVKRLGFDPSVTTTRAI